MKNYEWLKARNVWTGELIPDCSWYDDIPEGWRLAFGEQMCEELDKILAKADFQRDYRIVQIKEKFGFLHWYDNGVPDIIKKEFDSWLKHYEDLSEHTCIVCGDHGKIDYNEFWLIPLCESCRENINKGRN